MPSGVNPVPVTVALADGPTNGMAFAARRQGANSATRRRIRAQARYIASMCARTPQAVAGLTVCEVSFHSVRASKVVQRGPNKRRTEEVRSPLFPFSRAVNAHVDDNKLAARHGVDEPVECRPLVSRVPVDNRPALERPDRVGVRARHAGVGGSTASSPHWVGRDWRRWRPAVPSVRDDPRRLTGRGGSRDA